MALINGAGERSRTLDLLITSQLLYQLSYTGILWWLRTESNRRHKDFQSFALPTELPRQSMAVWTGLEPATSCVTGRHSNQLNYHTVLFDCGTKVVLIFDSASVFAKKLYFFEETKLNTSVTS